MRIGSGFDVHKFSGERKLILCGVEIPGHAGLLGNSDADVATHALMDALLGAAALGDIGKLFPDTDDTYKDANSIELLKHVVDILDRYSFRICNVDITIICETPKMAKYILAMRESLAKALEIDIKYVSVKATTTEKLGFTGRGEGIACEAVCLID